MRKSRLILYAIPVLIIMALFLLYQRYVSVRKDLVSIREEIAMKEQTLKKYMSLIAETPELEKRVAALKEIRRAEDAKLLEGQTDSIVSAGLQDTIREIVTGRSGSILSERAGKVEDLDNFRVITVTADTVLPEVRALADILYSIETRTPYLVVKDLDIRVRNYKTPKELSVKLEISGLTNTKER